MVRYVELSLTAAFLVVLTGCAPDYSPNTYSGNAVQQANNVERAVVIGFRQVEIRANGTIGAVTGGAAGGVLGAQAEPSGITSALGAVGGTLVGSVVGTTIEHTTGDTTGWEYIVRKTDGDLLSVTQRQPQPIPLGQKVLVITGNQARIIPDYSAALDPPAPSDRDKKDKSGTGTAPAETSQPSTESHATASAPASETATPASPSTAAAPAEPTPPSSPTNAPASMPSGL